MFHCAEDYLVTSDPRGGEREENIVNFPCRFECSIPFRLFLFEERRERPPFSSFFQAWLSPPSFLCRFRMPIKLTSCLVNDRIPGQIEFRLNTCAKWQEERRSATENEKIFVRPENSFDENRVAHFINENEI